MTRWDNAKKLIVLLTKHCPCEVTLPSPEEKKTTTYSQDEFFIYNHASIEGITVLGIHAKAFGGIEDINLLRYRLRDNINIGWSR
jgi:hypothetical protein